MTPEEYQTKLDALRLVLLAAGWDNPRPQVYDKALPEGTLDITGQLPVIRLFHLCSTEEGNGTIWRLYLWAPTRAVACSLSLDVENTPEDLFKNLSAYCLKLYRAWEAVQG